MIAAEASATGSDDSVELAISGAVNNAGGTIEGAGTTSGFALVYLSGTINNSGGHIAALGSASVDIDNATISGGALQTTGNGEITVLETSATILGATISAGSFIEDGATLTISGGTIGAGATIDASAFAIANISGTVANSGTLEAVGGLAASATLVIDGIVNDGTAGVILASRGVVDLDGATISGGTLRTSISGLIETVGASTNAINGFKIVSSSLVEVTSASTLMLSGGTIGAGATVETTSSGTVVVSGTVTNSGTLLASDSGSQITVASGAVVNGGRIEIGNGIVDIAGAGAESISFLSTGSGGLDIADKASATSVYAGKISGFGGGNHSNTSQFIDLVSVTYSAGETATYSANSSNTSGVLTVSSGGKAVTEINFVGAYVTSDFHLSAGISGTVAITDPPVVGGGVQSANIALLGNYMASMFATSAFNGGSVTSDTQTPQHTLLTHPHA